MVWIIMITKSMKSCLIFIYSQTSLHISCFAWLYISLALFFSFCYSNRAHLYHKYIFAYKIITYIHVHDIKSLTYFTTMISLKISWSSSINYMKQPPNVSTLISKTPTLTNLLLLPKGPHHPHPAWSGRLCKSAQVLWGETENQLQSRRILKG